MKQLTISTRRYNKLLENLTTFADAIKADRIGGLFFICYRYDQVQGRFAKGLMATLADIAVQENPIYQHSPKLQGIAHDLRKTPLYDAELKSLNRFIKHNRVLHLEGYVTFRMADYREKLDMMSYTLIKKLKLNQQD